MTVFTPNKGYGQPTVGGNNNTWGPPLNANVAALDNNLGGGGQTTLDCTGSASVTLTAAQAQNLIQNLTGALTGDINLILPALGGFYIVNNQTTGAFSITAITSFSGSRTGVVLPQGCTAVIYSDQKNVDFAVSTGAPGPGITNVTGSRAIGAPALNAGSRSIFVTATVTSDAAANAALTINGIEIVGSGSITPGTGLFVCGVVVPGQSYTIGVTAGTGTLLQATET